MRNFLNITTITDSSKVDRCQTFGTPTIKHVFCRDCTQHLKSFTRKEGLYSHILPQFHLCQARKQLTLKKVVNSIILKNSSKGPLDKKFRVFPIKKINQSKSDKNSWQQQ